ncbi:hypothetical protein C7S14_2967 [Burkholderia cepacia]|nr:hypothetical protein C7S14_2967 [Burkholderia cepacia]
MYYFVLSVSRFWGAMCAAGRLTAARRMTHSGRPGQAVRRMH